jgi:hypothetical protein
MRGLVPRIHVFAAGQDVDGRDVREDALGVFAQYGVSGVLVLMGAALLLMIVVVGWLGVEPERKIEARIREVGLI